MENAMKRFHGICLITPEIARLRRFYCDVLQVDAEGDEQFAAVTTVGATLTLYTEQGMEQLAPQSMQDAGHGGCTLEVEVADVDAEYARLLTLGIPIVKPPMTHPWGMRSVWFRDPDGNLIDFFAKVQRNGAS
jgi:catechol 2,3-dioxygenase-like lactoylglutathione lyase family enzyme